MDEKEVKYNEEGSFLFELLGVCVFLAFCVWGFSLIQEVLK